MLRNPIDKWWLNYATPVLVGCGLWSVWVFLWVAWVLWLGEFTGNDELFTRKNDPGVYWSVVGGATAAGVLVLAWGLWNRRRARLWQKAESRGELAPDLLA